MNTDKSPPLYAVYANQLDREQFLGVATGVVKDIEAYYDQKKSYGLRVEPLKIVEIPEGYAGKYEKLIKERVVLEERLKQLNKEINQ